MPRLTRHPQPRASPAGFQPSYPGTGAGYAQLAANSGYSQPNPLYALGLQFAQQGMGQQFARQVHDQRQYDQKQAENEAIQRSHAFLDDLAATSPDVINDPDFKPFWAAIAHGVMHPRDAMAGYESARQRKAQREAQDAQNRVRNSQNDTRATETNRHNLAMEGKGAPRGDSGPAFDADVADLMALHPGVTRDRAAAYIRQRNHKYTTEEPANISGRRTGNQTAANAMQLTPDELSMVIQGAAGDINKIGVARAELQRRGLDDGGQPNTPEAAWGEYQRAKAVYDALPDSTGHHLPWNHPIADAKAAMDSAYQRFLSVRGSTAAQAPAQQAAPRATPQQRSPQDEQIAAELRAQGHSEEEINAALAQ